MSYAQGHQNCAQDSTGPKNFKEIRGLAVVFALF